MYALRLALVAWPLSSFLPCLKRSRTCPTLLFRFLSFPPSALSFRPFRPASHCVPYHPQRSSYSHLAILYILYVCVLSLLHPLFTTSPGPQAIPHWIIHVIDVWTRFPLFLAICSPTLLTPSLSVLANHTVCRYLTFCMAFFASSQQELFEHRLRRSSSTASIRFRSRRPSGSQKSLSRSHISSPSHPLPSASTPDDTPSSQQNPSQTTLPSSVAKSGSPPSSRTTPLHARVNSMKTIECPLLLC